MDWAAAAASAIAQFVVGMAQGAAAATTATYNSVADAGNAAADATSAAGTAAANSVGGILGTVIQFGADLAAMALRGGGVVLGVAAAAVVGFIVFGAWLLVLLVAVPVVIILAPLGFALSVFMFVFDLARFGLDLLLNVTLPGFFGAPPIEAQAPDIWLPVYHFHPITGWLSDPNGLVHHQGTFHLFFQHVPLQEPTSPPDFRVDAVTWGHARSADLVRWTDAELALTPAGGLGLPLSGSAIVDVSNDSALCADNGGCIVAAFTNLKWYVWATQWLATGSGGIFTRRFEVLSELRYQFRDPRLVRLDDQTERPWLMIVAAGDHLRFYRSAELQSWTRVGTFSRGLGFGEVCECPDLIRLPDPDGGQSWVLIFSVLKAGTRYFVGDFDGVTFTERHLDARDVDSGPDFYALQTWSGVQDRSFAIAWMSPWVCPACAY